MPDLKNSQRINYKATYNQISPGVPQAEEPNPNPNNPRPERPKHGVTVLKRGLEKTAFMQSLNIQPKEFSAIRANYMERRYNDSNSKEVLKMIYAIEVLVNDKTSTSTLNNASNFSEIDYKTIIEFGQSVIEHRNNVSESIEKSISEIISRYQESQKYTAGEKPTDSTNSGNIEDQKKEGLNILSIVEDFQ